MFESIYTDMNFENLKVYQESATLELQIRKISDSLPNVEKYELGNQIRRAAQSIRANIAEGYGKRRHKKEFIRFLYIALASNDEIRSHLKQIEAIYPDLKVEHVIEQSVKKGKMLTKFIQGVKKHYR